MNTVNKTTEMSLSAELVWRGLLNQTTFKDITEIDKKTFTIYHGFDASADSQTIGNLAAMMVDLCFLRHGHKTIVLAGGATSLIGDTGGRDKERVLQTKETIAFNIERAKEQIQKIYGKHDFLLVNNLDWTENISAIDFLRDIGKYFNVGEMIKKEYIANRLGPSGAGISHAEFSYELLQGYDFLHLFQTYDCTLQIGGADQWTNCLAGVDLIRKKHEKEAHVITLPLIINKKTGKKFGKSEEGAVWLDKNKTSIYDFYQFWINVDDDNVGDYIKIYTDIMLAEYDLLMQNFANNTADRSAQKYLALSVTTLVHGEDAALQARSVSEFLFGQKTFSDLSGAEITLLMGTIPVIQFDPNKELVDSFVDSGHLSSKRQAREFIENGAISIFDRKITDVKYSIQETDFVRGVCLVRKGKKDYYGIGKN